MMKIDTSQVPGWEDRTVVLTFRHWPPQLDGGRFTAAMLVEHYAGGTKKRKIVERMARCSPVDQFCRETGRRIAIKRLMSAKTCAPHELMGAAVHQYFDDRAARRRAA